MKRILLILLTFFIYLNILYSWQEPDSLAISNISSTFLGEPNIGDTLNFQINITSNISSTFSTILDYTDHITPLNNDSGQTSALGTLVLDSGTTTQINYPLKVNSIGTSDLSFKIKLLGNPIALRPISSNNYLIKSKQVNGEIIQLENDDEIPIDSYQEVGPIESGTKHDIIINGKVTYTDYYSEIVNGKYPQKGAFNYVRIWYNLPESSDPNKLYLLKSLDLYGKYIKGIHYTVCDQDGNFSFNLNDIKLPMTGPINLWVSVQKENETTILISPGFIYNVNPLSPYSDIIRIYPSELQLIKIPVNLNTLSHIYNDVNITIPFKDGSVFRFNEISKQTLLNAFEVNDVNDLPFTYIGYNNTNKLYTSIDNSGACYYWGNHKIWLGDPRPFKVAHEFGHFIDDLMNDDAGVSGDKYTYEGWAEFFSFAVLNFANNNYGDIFNSGDENADIAPYYYLNLNGFGYNAVNLRYGNIPKSRVYWNDPRGSEYGEFASFLWNIYDGYDKGNYLMHNYRNVSLNNRDNDDFNGYKKEVFECIHETNSNVSWTNAGYLNAFKNKLSPENSRPDLEDALAVLYLFLKDETKTTHSAQVQINENTGFVFDDDQQMISFDIGWDSRSYQQASLADDFVKYGFNPGEGAAIFDNYEDGVKIYYSDSPNGPWTYLTSKPKYINIYSMPCGMTPDPCGTDQLFFKLTSYNSSGNSVDFNIIPNIPSIPIKDPMDIEDKSYFKDIKLTLSPNPTNEFFILNMEIPSLSSVKIELYNTNSQKIDEIFEENDIVGKYKIHHNTTKYSNGNYFVRIILMNHKGLIMVKNLKLNIVK